MAKNLPIIMASNTERTGRKIESYQLIKRGLLITPILISNAYADENSTYSFDLPAQPLSATLDRLAQSSHTKLIYSDATVKGVSAAPRQGKVHGSTSVEYCVGQERSSLQRGGQNPSYRVRETH